MKKSCLFLLFSICLTAGVCRAALLAYEGFGSGGSAVPLNGLGGGTGFSSAWTYSTGASTQIHHIGQGGNYVYPGNVFWKYSPGISQHLSSYIRSIGTRNLDSSINMAADGEYFVSFIFRDFAANPDSEATVSFANATGQLHFGYRYSDRFSIGTSTADQMLFQGSPTDASFTSVGNTRYFVVARVVTRSASNDEIYLKAYNSITESVHGSYTNLSGTGTGTDEWTVTLSLDSSEVFDRMGLNSSGISFPSVDEVRIGTTWDDMIRRSDFHDELLVYESFGFAGTLNGSSGPRSFGFASASNWVASGSFFLDPIGYTFPAETEPWHYSGGGRVAVANNNNQLATRHLAQPIDMSVDATYYLSFAHGGVHFSNIGLAGAGAWLTAGMNTADQAYLHGTSYGTFPGPAVPAGDDRFYVMKITAVSNGSDTVQLNVYDDTVPLAPPDSWSITMSIIDTNVYDRALMFYGWSSPGGGLDEYRLGTSWNAAVFGGAPLVNLPASGIQGTSTWFNAGLNAADTNAEIYVHWGTTDGGTNASDWSHTEWVGSWNTTQITNLRVFTTDLVPGTENYYTFRTTHAGTNFWAEPSVAFTTLDFPMVTSDVGASNVGTNSATLSGMLTLGTSADVYICWGDHDAGANLPSDWDNAIPLGSINQSVPFSDRVSGFGPGTTYYYRCYATNALGDAWSDPAERFRSISTNGLDLAFDKNVDAASLLYGDLLTYTLDVFNVGTLEAGGVVVTDTLPAGVSFSKAFPSAAQTNGNNYVFDLGLLTSGEGTSIVLSVVVTDAVPNVVLTNRAWVATVDLEVNLANNRSEATTLLPDSDGDGINNPLDPNDDNDRMSDEDESIANTDPLDPNSFLWLSILSTPDPSVRILQFPTSTERTYSIQGSTNLQADNWSNYLSGVVGLGGLTNIPDTNVNKRVYYRIGVEAP